MKERSGMPYDVVAISTDELALQWTPAEEGIFHRLIRHAWINGSIPAAPAALAVICRIPESEFNLHWPAVSKSFYVDPRNSARLLNKKQERERSFISGRRKQQQAAGRRSAEVRRQRSENKAPTNGRSTTVQRTVDASLNLPPLPVPSLPSPSQPVPVPIHSPILEVSSVPPQNGEHPNGRTNGSGKEFQKFWGPVEGYIRQQVVEEAFSEFYAGCRIVAMNSNAVTLAVPQALIDHDGGIGQAVELMTQRILNSKTGLLRGRVLKLISVEDLVREALS